MNKLPSIFWLLILSFNVLSADFYYGDLSIKKIRAVGDYKTGSVFDNTIELWFVSPVTWPSNSGCTSTSRVYINAANQHMVSAAYMAFASGKTVNVNVDNTLPNRGGSCEVSYIDVNL